MSNKKAEYSKMDARDSRVNRHNFWKKTRRNTVLVQIRFA